MQLGIQDFHLAIGLNVAGSNLAGAGSLDEDGLGTLAVQLGQQILHVQHDLRDILLDAGDGGKLVLDTGNLDAGGCSAGQRGEQDATQGIAQCRSVAALQGFDQMCIRDRVQTA